LALHEPQEDQLDLLCRVLTAGLEEAGIERGANEDEDEALQADRSVSTTAAAPQLVL